MSRLPQKLRAAQDAIRRIRKLGGRWILCNHPDHPDPKAPDVSAMGGPGYFDRDPLDADAVIRHYERGNLIGLEPSSLGCCVVDCDGVEPAADDDAVRKNRALAVEVGALLGESTSQVTLRSLSYDRKGSAHVWARRERPAAGADWNNRTKLKLRGDADKAIDFRWHRTYVVTPSFERLADWLCKPESFGKPTWNVLEQAIDSTTDSAHNGKSARAPIPLATLLKRAGISAKPGEKILCPFPAHNDTKPSFEFRETNGRGRYKCWGCGRQGDFVDWLQQYEGLTIQQAMTVAYGPGAGGGADRPPDGGGAEDAGEDNRRAFEHTLNGLAAALEYRGIALRYDLRANAIQWRFDGGDWIPDEDVVSSYVQNKLLAEGCNSLRPHKDGGLQVRKGYRLSRRDFDEFTTGLLFNRKFDAFEDYLKGLPKWDGTGRLDRILSDLLGAEDTELNRFGSAMVLIQAARYVTHAGFKCDESLLLVGNTTIGKSSVYQLAIPRHLRAAGYTDKPKLTMTDKELGESLESAIIAELAEVSLGLRDTAAAKRWLTSVDDGGFRPAYGRRRQSRPRRAALFATADKRNCMSSDPAMNRRFVPVWCEGKLSYTEIKSWWDENREQCWAEAVVRAAHGDPYLPAHLRREQLARAVDMQADRGSLHDEIDRYEGKLDGRCIADIRWIMRVDPLVRDYDLRRALLDCGYVAGSMQKVVEEGKRKSYRPWYRPDWTPAADFAFRFVRTRRADAEDETSARPAVEDETPF